MVRFSARWQLRTFLFRVFMWETHLYPTIWHFCYCILTSLQRLILYGLGRFSHDAVLDCGGKRQTFVSVFTCQDGASLEARSPRCTNGINVDTVHFYKSQMFVFWCDNSCQSQVKKAFAWVGSLRLQLVLVKNTWFCWPQEDDKSPKVSSKLSNFVPPKTAVMCPNRSLNRTIFPRYHITAIHSSWYLKRNSRQMQPGLLLSSGNNFPHDISRDFFSFSF